MARFLLSPCQSSNLGSCGCNNGTDPATWHRMAKKRRRHALAMSTNGVRLHTPRTARQVHEAGLFRAVKEPCAPREGVIKKTTQATNPNDHTLGGAKGTVISSLKRKRFVDALEESSRRKYNALKQLDPTHEFVQRTDKFMENKCRTAQCSKNSEITDRTKKALIAFTEARATRTSDLESVTFKLFRILWFRKRLWFFVRSPNMSGVLILIQLCVFLVFERGVRHCHAISDKEVADRNAQQLLRSLKAAGIDPRAGPPKLRRRRPEEHPRALYAPGGSEEGDALCLCSSPPERRPRLAVHINCLQAEGQGG